MSVLGHLPVGFYFFFKIKKNYLCACVYAMFVQIRRESSRVFRARITDSCEMPSQLLGTEFKSSRKSASTLTTEPSLYLLILFL